MSNIDGWCDFQWLYDDVAAKFPNGNFIEVGVWQGQSIIHLAQQLIKQNGKARIYGVDTWEGSVDEKVHQDFINSIGGADKLYERFLNNIKSTQTNDIILPLKGRSLEIGKILPDKYFDFIFIDASHTYEDFKADLIAWKDKVKSGGELWGHDAPWPPIIRVLNELYPKQWSQHKTCWKLDIEF